MLTRIELGKALLDELRHGYDVVRISRWAYRLHLDTREFEEELESELLKLVAMEEGPEFEISEKDLRSLANSLIE